jgi:hypothetical protein
VLRPPRATIVVALIACCAALPACGGDDKTEAFNNCGRLLYSAQQDDGAFNIRVASASCRLAQDVARAGRNVDLGGETIDYDALGFTCKGILLERDDRPLIDYTCTNESSGAVVKYTRP